MSKDFTEVTGEQSQGPQRLYPATRHWNASLRHFPITFIVYTLNQISPSSILILTLSTLKNTDLKKKRNHAYTTPTTHS